jgi:hypothetical protein
MPVLNDMHILAKVAAVNNMLAPLHLPASVSYLPHSGQFFIFSGLTLICLIYKEDHSCEQSPVIALHAIQHSHWSRIFSF